MSPTDGPGHRDGQGRRGAGNETGGHDPERPDPPDRPDGTIGVTGPGPLVVLGVIGLVGGWSLRPLSIRMGFIEPSVPLTAIAALFFVAAVVGGSAYVTRRVVRRERSSLAHHQAVNRLVLGKACALAGALVAGGYLGFALAQVGVGDPASPDEALASPGGRSRGADRVRGGAAAGACVSRAARGRLGTYARAMAAAGLPPRTPSSDDPGTRPSRRSRPDGRRRQRSVRVTVSVSLLVAASVLVLVALPTRSALWLSVASVSALLLSWAALRMMWTEVLQSRRENAADRSAAAAAYRTLFTARAAEHAEFTTAMTERLAEAHLSRRELEGRMVLQQTRALQAESELAEGSKALTASQQKIQELEMLLAVRQAEEEDALASWEPSSRPERPRLVKEA